MIIESVQARIHEVDIIGKKYAVTLLEIETGKFWGDATYIFESYDSAYAFASRHKMGAEHCLSLIMCAP